MIGYSLYFLLAVGLSMLLTAAFRRLRRDDGGMTPPEEDVAFDRRMAEIEARYGIDDGPAEGGPGAHGAPARKGDAPR